MSSSLATSAAEGVCTPRIIYSGHAWCPGNYLSKSVLPLLKAMHHICLLSWYYTYSIHLHQLAVDFHWSNTSHTKIKTHFMLQRLTWFRQTIHLQSDLLIVLTDRCTMTQSMCAKYMLKSAVPWYYIMSDMMLPLFFFLTSLCTRQREKTQNMVQGTHTQQGLQLGWIKICHSFWTIILPLV